MSSSILRQALATPKPLCLLLLRSGKLFEPAVKGAHAISKPARFGSCATLQHYSVEKVASTPCLHHANAKRSAVAMFGPQLAACTRSDSARANAVVTATFAPVKAAKRPWYGNLQHSF